MSLFDTTTLIGMVDAMDRPTAFLRDTFFPNVVTSNDEEVAIDKMLSRKKMAPFVSPDVPAKERAARGRKVESFRPAYVKPMSTIRPNDLVKRQAGEGIGGQLSPADRRTSVVSQTLLDQDDEITRREEWMCAQVLRSGQVVVDGDDYERQVVDFSRAAGQTVALTSAARWGESGVKPLSNLKTWATLTQKASGGAVRNVILGTGAADLLQNDADLATKLDNNRQISGSFELGPIAAGEDGMPAVYIGSIGVFNFWQYAQWFEDDAGSEVEIWPEYGVGMVSSAFRGNMAYGAILDMDALVPVSRFPKNFMTDNPSREHLLTQSAPLPVPSDVSGSFFATVR